MTASPETVNAGAEGSSSRDDALWPSSFWYIAATERDFETFLRQREERGEAGSAR